MTREEIEKLSVVEPYRFESQFEEIWYEVGCIDGLKAADAEPNLERLWHDASEEPLLEETEIIFINERDFAHISKRKGGHFSYSFVYYSWEEYVNSLKIKKWAYVKDLLPKGGKK